MTHPIGLMGSTALIAAPNSHTQSLIETRLRPLLNSALSEILGRDVQIAVTVDTSLSSEPPSGNGTGPAAAPEEPIEPEVSAPAEPGLPGARHDFGFLPPAPHDPIEPYQQGTRIQSADPQEVREPEPEPPAADVPEHRPRHLRAVAAPRPLTPTRLNPRYTFENFVRGPSNRLAYAAASAVAEAPAKAYNPLFIYGGSGLGKTHLLHAIGNYAQQVFPEIKVLYVSSEEFTNDFINAIANVGRGGGDQREQFRRRYRDVDILMIDDIQFLERAEQTQEEFFHTFNTLHNANKQIVITSDRTPKELTTLEDRLRSRFAGGLTPDIQTPDLETRLAILRRKAAQEGITLSPEVMELIATQIQSNIRELEGALIRVSAFANLTDQGVDLGVAQHVLKDLIPDSQGETTNAPTIMQIVAEYFDVSIDDLTGRNRSKTLVMPRQIAMYLCRELTDLSLPRIGQYFGGKDHTTVMHAVKKVTNEMKENRHTYNQVAELTAQIKTKGRQ